ncbi:MAG: glycosyltransferase family 4 protein [Patescibacteria group bacterium]|nr:glycosyltransferase family 4 protein [Patescibacteria group bacterium]
MKVLFVSHAYVEESNRRKLFELAKFDGLEVGVIFPKHWKTWHGEEKDQLTIDNGKLTYEEHALDTFFSGDAGRYIYYPIQLIISIIKFKPDLVHVEEEPFCPVSFEAAFVCWLLGVKMSFFTWENIADLKLGFWRRLSEKFVLLRSLAAVAGNSGAKERLIKKGFKKKIGVFPQFGVDTEVFYPGPLPPSKDLLSSVTVGFVGRLALAKGVDLLLEAVKMLPERFGLLIVSSSPKVPTSFTDQINALGIGPRLKIQTGVPHAELADWYRQMDIYVLPSRTTPTWQEQFGRTMIEAMACGVPVIGSSSGAIPEVVGGGGLIFREGDAEDLVYRITKLSDPETHKLLRETALKRSIGEFSNEIICRRIADFVVQIFSSSK